MTEENKGRETLLSDVNQAGRFAWLLDLAFVIWLVVSAALFLYQFRSFVDPLLRRLGML
jgi:hypothetical protein